MYPPPAPARGGNWGPAPLGRMLPAYIRWQHSSCLLSDQRFQTDTGWATARGLGAKAGVIVVASISLLRHISLLFPPSNARRPKRRVIVRPRVVYAWASKVLWARSHPQCPRVNPSRQWPAAASHSARREAMIPTLR